MTFDEALKKLAEKWPEKFEIHTNLADSMIWWGNDAENFSLLTQDDIDSILALIGWECEVTKTYYDPNSEDPNKGVSLVWWAHIWKADEGEFDATQRTVNVGANTKLTAAQAALIAVVEREVKP